MGMEYLFTLMMVTPTSDLSVAGADLHVAVVAVRGAAVPHAVGLCPVVTVVAVGAPGAGVRLRVRGGGGGSLTPGLQRPVLLPGVQPVLVILPVPGEALWTLPPVPVEDPPEVLAHCRPDHPHAGARQEEQVIVSALLGVNSPARGG